MANCKHCGKHVDCDCTLFEGKYCSACYSNLLAENKIVAKAENTCNQTLEELERKKQKIETLFADSKVKKTKYKVLINSQIKKLDTDPCKYYDQLSFL